MDAERQVLGAIMLDNNAIKRIDLSADEFYGANHKIIYMVMQDLSTKGIALDMTTITNKIQGIEQPFSLVSGIASECPTSQNIKHHAEIVREKAEKRKLVEGCMRIANGKDDLSVREMREIMREASKNASGTGIKTISAGDLAQNTLKYVETVMKDPDGVVGVPTGFTDIDEMMGGLMKGDLIVLASRPAMGKSAFKGNIALHAAQKGHGVLLFELEMGKEQTGIRHFSDLGNIPTWHLRHGKMKAHYQQMLKATGELSELPIDYCFTGHITVEQIWRETERLVHEKGIGLVVVDYLQLIHTSKRKREEEVSHISRTLKNMAVEFQIPVIAVAQLNRDCEKRGADKRPLLSDLRESGAVEQDADVVIFLYRDEYYYPKTTKEKGIAEVIFAKGRQFKTGIRRLKWDGHYIKFRNLITKGGYDAYD